MLDITDQQSIINNIKYIKPDYIINLAAQSYVGESWNTYTYIYHQYSISNVFFRSYKRILSKV